MKKFLLFCCLLVATTAFTQNPYVPFDNPVDQAVLNDLFSNDQTVVNTIVYTNVTVAQPNYASPIAIPWQSEAAITYSATPANYNYNYSYTSDPVTVMTECYDIKLDNDYITNYYPWIIYPKIE